MTVRFKTFVASLRSLAVIATLAAWLPPTTSFGEESVRVAEFSVTDVAGKPHTKTDWKASSGVVLLFLGTECPVSNYYAPEMARLNEQFAPRGVRFYGIHPDPAVTSAAAAEHAKKYGLSFPIVLDGGQRITSQAGVKVTPECAVLSPTGDVLYHGRIDDLYSTKGKRRNEARVRDLRFTLEAIVGGKPITISHHPAFGCPLPEAKK